MWICPKCGEQHEDQYDSCWKCARAKPEFAEPGISVPPPMAESPVSPARTRVAFKTFRGTMPTFNQLFSEAAAFATDIGPERLITISHSEDNNDGVVAVWYWE
jgi:hypothetical protein